ncbi:SGNH/GDSL hydrolase family protein [Dactylosporangium sp. CA-092794]|uniref:SGNH/GDSL hydrolase family protein n=1 Tax=Dactylosporangium sp. CA-092794 TaxID=3239929 RepID=UPI003D93D85A
MRIVMTLTVAAAGLAVAAPQAAAAADATVKVMPLGASITWGTNSSDGNGYRETLRRHLTGEAGLSIDYVGSQRSGTAADNDNEGHPGYRIDQVAAGATGWLTTYRPDVVLLNVGTNDTIQNYDLPNAPARLRALIDQIIAADPGVSVIFSTLVPSRDATNNARVQAFNAALPAIAQAEAAAGHDVHLADLNGTLTAADIGADGIHPTDAGYVKLADLWFAAARPVLGAGRDWPLFNADFGNGAKPLPTWTDSVDSSLNVGGYCCNLPGMESGRRQEIAHGGVYALMYSGTDTSASRSYSYNRVFDVHIPIASGTRLTYWIYPQTQNATSVALDLALLDHRSLRDSGAVDQWGVRAHPQFQGEGGHLVLNQWNQVQVNLTPLAGGTIDQIWIGYDQPANTGQFRGYVDDILITAG